MRFLIIALWLATTVARAAHTDVKLLLSVTAARPGDTVWAGVQLKMEPGWHTYWKNPGAAGQATEIKWQLPAGVTAGEIQWPLPEVWIGVSVEDQKTADERISLLLQTPAAVRFVSLEPMLGPVDISRFLRKEPISLIIVGGESGPGARPFDLDWARSVRDQCAAAGVLFFMKQLGSHPVSADPIGSAWALAEGYQPSGARILLKDRKGGDMAEFPSDLRIREFPESRG